MLASLLLSACKPPDPVSFEQIDDDAVIVPSNRLEAGSVQFVGKMDKAWTPDKEEAKRVISRVKSTTFWHEPSTRIALKSMPDQSQLERLPRIFAESRMQVLGIVRGNQRLLVVSGFPRDELEQKWKNDIVEVSDGGEEFWRAYFDESDGRLLYLAWNGVG